MTKHNPNQTPTMVQYIMIEMLIKPNEEINENMAKGRQSKR